MVQHFLNFLVLTSAKTGVRNCGVFLSKSIKFWGKNLGCLTSGFKKLQWSLFCSSQFQYFSFATVISFNYFVKLYGVGLAAQFQFWLSQLGRLIFFVLYFQVINTIICNYLNIFNFIEVRFFSWIISVRVHPGCFSFCFTVMFS